MSDEKKTLSDAEIARMKSAMFGVEQRLHAHQQQAVPQQQPVTEPEPQQPFAPQPVAEPAPQQPEFNQPLQPETPPQQQPVTEPAPQQPFAPQQQPVTEPAPQQPFAPQPVTEPEPQQPFAPQPVAESAPQQPEFNQPLQPETPTQQPFAPQQQPATEQPVTESAPQQPANLFAAPPQEPSPEPVDSPQSQQPIAEPESQQPVAEPAPQQSANLFAAPQTERETTSPQPEQPSPESQSENFPPAPPEDAVSTPQPAPTQQFGAEESLSPQPDREPENLSSLETPVDAPLNPNDAGSSSPLLKSQMPGSQQASPELPVPQDILMAIAIDDPRIKEDMIDRSAISQLRDNSTLVPTSKKAQKKVSLEPLPFDQLQSGVPLIATVYSPSGGVGKSSTSMNLGVYIAAVAATMAKKKSSQGADNVRVPRILTLDGDIDMGSLLLRLSGLLEPNIYDLLTYIDEREGQGFEGSSAWPQSYDNPAAGEKGMSEFVFWPMKLPNFNVLGAAKEPDLFWDFGPNDYRNVLKMLGNFYDVIIIDSGINVILESQRAWLAHANEVFLITAPDIDRIFNAAKASRYIAQSRAHPQDTREDAPVLPALVTSDKLSVVMTRCDADAGINLEENVSYFFQWLREDQKFWIPDVSTEMTQANNNSRFLVLENPEYAKVISKMAKHVFQRYITTRKQRSLPPAAESATE